jgi:hypothetical protein
LWPAILKREQPQGGAAARDWDFWREASSDAVPDQAVTDRDGQELTTAGHVGNILWSGYGMLRESIGG